MKQLNVFALNTKPSTVKHTETQHLHLSSQDQDCLFMTTEPHPVPPEHNSKAAAACEVTGIQKDQRSKEVFTSSLWF